MGKNLRRLNMTREPLRVLSLFCGAGKEREPIIKRAAGRPVEYTGVDDKSYQRGKPYHYLTKFTHLNQAGLSENYVQANLNFRNAVEFRRELEKISNGKKFHEIHIHMPENITGHGNVALSVLGDFLKDKGWIYHSATNFHHTDSIIDAGNLPLVDDGKPIQPNSDLVDYRIRRTAYNGIASKHGFDLKFWAFRKTKVSNLGHPEYEPWVFSTKRTSSKKENNKLAGRVYAHSDYGLDAGEFMILRKK